MKIEIYTTPTCVYCKMAKEFLKSNNIEYENIDVSTDHEKAHEMIEKSGQMGVPVIIIEKDGEEEVIAGFDKPKLLEVLGIK